MNEYKKATARLQGGCFYGTDVDCEWYYTRSEPEATCLFHERNLYIDQNARFYSYQDEIYRKLEGEK
jgi:hypothetical protein